MAVAIALRRKSHARDSYTLHRPYRGQAFSKTFTVPALRSGAVAVHQHTPTEVSLPSITGGAADASDAGRPASASDAIVSTARGVQALRKSKSDRTGGSSGGGGGGSGGEGDSSNQEEPATTTTTRTTRK